eukprot:scaffold23125_cov91-Cyclotella_meneghiniana.AAC.10
MTGPTAKSLMLFSAALLTSAQLTRVHPQRLRRSNAIDSSGYNEEREFFGKQSRNLEELSLSMSMDISSIAMDEEMADATKAPSYWPTYYPTITWTPTSNPIEKVTTAPTPIENKVTTPPTYIFSTPEPSTSSDAAPAITV